MIIRRYLFLYSEWTNENFQFIMMCTCFFFCIGDIFYSRKNAPILHLNIICSGNKKIKNFNKPCFRQIQSCILLYLIHKRITADMKKKLIVNPQYKRLNKIRLNCKHFQIIL